jgi:hypothetical protein
MEKFSQSNNRKANKGKFALYNIISRLIYMIYTNICDYRVRAKKCTFKEASAGPEALQAWRVNSGNI